MVETVHLVQRNYERALPYVKEESDGTMKRRDEKTAKAERCGPYLICHRITISVHEMARAVDTGVQKRSAATFASDLVVRSKESTI